MIWRAIASLILGGSFTVALYHSLYVLLAEVTDRAERAESKNNGNFRRLCVFKARGLEKNCKDQETQVDQIDAIFLFSSKRTSTNETTRHLDNEYTTQSCRTSLITRTRRRARAHTHPEQRNNFKMSPRARSSPTGTKSSTSACMLLSRSHRCLF